MLLRRERASAIDGYGAPGRDAGAESRPTRTPALWSRIEGFDPTSCRADIAGASGRAGRDAAADDDPPRLGSRLPRDPAAPPAGRRAAVALQPVRAGAGRARHRRGAGRQPRAVLAERPQTGERDRQAPRRALAGPRRRGAGPRGALARADGADPAARAVGRGGQPVLETVERWLGAPLDRRPSLDDARPALPGRLRAGDGQGRRRLVVADRLGEVVERLRPRLRTFRDEAGRELFDVPDAPLPDPETPGAGPVPARVRQPAPLARRPQPHGRSRVQGPALVARLGPRRRLRGRHLATGAPRGRLTVRIGFYRSMADAELAEVEAEATRLAAFLAPDGEREIVTAVPGRHVMSARRGARCGCVDRCVARAPSATCSSPRRAVAGTVNRPHAGSCRSPVFRRSVAATCTSPTPCGAAPRCSSPRSCLILLAGRAVLPRLGRARGDRDRLLHRRGRQVHHH